jgi:hypothetical protein
VHNVNYWNVYANYFKDHTQQELARLKEEGVAADSSKGKGKEIPVEVHGTPSESTMQIMKFENAI